MSSVAAFFIFSLLHIAWFEPADKCICMVLTGRQMYIVRFDYFRPNSPGLFVLGHGEPAIVAPYRAGPFSIRTGSQRFRQPH